MDGRRRDVFTALHDHFSPIETPDYLHVESLDDLTPAIELFHTLIELERYEDAFGVFRDRLERATLYRLSASRLRIELVERLFPDGVDQPPRLSQPRDQGDTLNALALAYQFSGQPGAVGCTSGLYGRRAAPVDNSPMFLLRSTGSNWTISILGGERPWLSASASTASAASAACSSAPSPATRSSRWPRSTT